jgi:hypothetical protein
MLFVGDKSGQLANRLFSFSHFIAHAMTNDYKLINLNFDEYCNYFKSTQTNKLYKSKITVRLSNIEFLNKGILKILSVLISIGYKLKADTLFYVIYRIYDSFDKKDCEFNMDQKDFVDTCRNKIVITQGWLFRSYQNIDKNKSIIKKYFEPSDYYLANINFLINKCRGECDVLVGIHIRRGDYDKFCEGKYLFNIESFVAQASQTVALFAKENKKVGFVVCSSPV